MTCISSTLADRFGLRAIVDLSDDPIVQMADDRHAKNNKKTTRPGVEVSISNSDLLLL